MGLKIRTEEQGRSEYLRSYERKHKTVAVLSGTLLTRGRARKGVATIQGGFETQLIWACQLQLTVGARDTQTKKPQKRYAINSQFGLDIGNLLIS